MPTPLEMLLEAGGASLHNLSWAFGGSTVKSLIDKDPDTDPPYVIRPSQLEALRRKFIEDYLKQQQLLRQNSKTLRSKIVPKINTNSPTVDQYIKTVNS